MTESIKRESSIQGIVKQGLCIGCGTCAAICPKDALTILESPETSTYLPRLDSSKCNQCGFCLRVCPGIEADFGKMNLLVFGHKPIHSFAGNYMKCYSGYAADKNMRCKSTSGGLVSALAAFALKIGIADGVLTTCASTQKPLRPQSFIARTEEEVISAAGSKYCPVSANSALDGIMRQEGRYVVIGLPCHIQGLRKAQGISKELRNNISLVFGLVCNHSPTFQATDFLLKKYKIPNDKIVRLDYRSKGWPGFLKIVLDDGSEKLIPFSSLYYWGYVFQRFFWPKRCIVCNDKLCQFADIVFMDAWLPEFSQHRTGFSLIVVRSKKGEDFISKAVEKEVVKLQPMSIEAVLKSQQLLKVIGRVAVTRIAMKYPSGEQYASGAGRLLPTPSISNLLDAFHLLFINRFCSNSSKLSRLVIECHVKLWSFALSAKRMVTKL